MFYGRKTLCLLLALGMLLGLAACGSTTESKPTASSEPVEETYVYTGAFTPITDCPENGLSTMAFTAEGIYAQSFEKIGQREIPEDAVIHYEGEYDIYGSALYFVDNGGKVKKLNAYTGIEAPEDTENREDYYASNELSRIFINDDGTLTALETLYLSWYDGPENERYGDNQWMYRENEQQYFLRTLDSSGKELTRTQLQLEAMDEDEYLNLYGCILTGDDKFICCSGTKLYVFGSDGTIEHTIECAQYPDNLLALPDGRIGMVAWGDSGVALYIVELEKDAVGEEIPLPRSAYNFIPGGGGFDLYYTNGSNLFGFNLGDTEGTKVLNWINVDVNGDRVGSAFNIDENGTIRTISNDYVGDKVTSELVTLSLVPASSLPVKQTLVLGVMYLDYQVQQKLIDFNRHSDTARIEVHDYSEYNTEDDYSAGLTKLTTEIMAGNLPDILCLNQLPYDQLASKGLLVDLYPYLDADKELNREDFFPTVLSALEVNGGLYQVAPSFQILTLIGASSVVGDTPGWTYDEFNAALASMPAGCSPLDQYTTQSDILRRLVTLEMDSLVDWNTGKCAFDSDIYVNILEFSKRFQTDFDWDNYEWSPEDSTETRIAEGRQMLMSGNIYSVDDLLYNDLYFGGDATYIGYPTSEGVGSMMTLSSGFAMSTGCADKDAAWNFLRTVLTEDYQNNIWGLPINRSAFQKKLDEAMTPTYQKDEDGNFILDEEGERIEISRGGIGMADGSVRNFYAMTQEQADKLLDVINTTTRVSNSNDSLLSIVEEEAQSFFAGQKTAEEVARLTQSKVNLYVNEQR